MTLNLASGMGLFSLEQLEERSALGSQRTSTWPPSEQEMLLWENPVTCAGIPGKHGHTRVFYRVQKVPRPIELRANQVYEMRN